MTASSLNLLFTNNTGLPDDEVFVSFQNPAKGSTNFDVTYSGGTPVTFASSDNLMSDPLNLAQIGAGGFTVTTLVGGIIFISYGKALTSTTSSPSYIGSGDDYDTPFQPFELTRQGNAGDQGDLTAINYFTAPQAIDSYNGGTGGTRLQSVAYTADAATIGAAIGALTGNSPSSVIQNGDGAIVRYIGPSSFGPADSNPFPSFLDYVKAVQKAGQTTSIVNNNAFNVPSSGGKGSINYNFTLNLVATAESDGSISMTGDITTTITPYGSGSSNGPTFSGCTLTLSASDINLYNFTIYGQALSGATLFGGGWNDLDAYMTSVGLEKQGAYATTQNLAVGEITSGLLMGFVNSPVVPAGHTTPLKDMDSDQWWSLSPVQAFSQIQTLNPYYNTYANLLYLDSNNEVYSIPYSDRLGSGPLVNSVQYDGQSVDTWMVTLAPPVSAS